jgi:hypothetical protein
MAFVVSIVAALKDEDVLYHIQVLCTCLGRDMKTKWPSSSPSSSVPTLGQCGTTCSGCIDQWLPAMLAPHRYGYEAIACLGVQPIAGGGCTVPCQSLEQEMTPETMDRYGVLSILIDADIHISISP